MEHSDLIKMLFFPNFFNETFTKIDMFLCKVSNLTKWHFLMETYSSENFQPALVMTKAVPKAEKGKS